VNARFRIPLLAALAAHLGLFGAVGLFYAPWRERESGASVIAVKLLVEEGKEPPAPKRVRETRAVWTPREAVTPPSRARSVPREASRAPARATRPEPPPPAPAMAPAVAQSPAPALLPRPAATAEQPMMPLSVAQPTVEEYVSVPPAPPPAEAAAPSQGDRAKGPEEAIVRASLLSECKPVYPRHCRIHGEEGTVVLSVEVAADGRPGVVAVVESSGHTRLDEAAVEALRRARFLPATRGGRPVPSVKRVAVAFRLRDAGEEDAEE